VWCGCAGCVDEIRESQQILRFLFSSVEWPLRLCWRNSTSECPEDLRWSVCSRLEAMSVCVDFNSSPVVCCCCWLESMTPSSRRCGEVPLAEVVCADCLRRSCTLSWHGYWLNKRLWLLLLTPKKLSLSAVLVVDHRHIQLLCVLFDEAQHSKTPTVCTTSPQSGSKHLHRQSPCVSLADDDGLSALPCRTGLSVDLFEFPKIRRNTLLRIRHTELRTLS